MFYVLRTGTDTNYGIIIVAMLPQSILSFGKELAVVRAAFYLFLGLL
jgi:hypothetical protein